MAQSSPEPSPDQPLFQPGDTLIQHWDKKEL